MEIPISLQTHPELRRRLQQTRETQRRVCRDAALAEHNLIQTVQRNAKAMRGLDLFAEDIDATYDELKSSGANIVEPLEKKPGGLRQFTSRTSTETASISTMTDDAPHTKRLQPTPETRAPEACRSPR